jgi:hypothetical protein
MEEQLLKEYVGTYLNPKYNGDWDVVNSKFPELSGVDKEILKEYVGTYLNPKYNGDWNVVNSKFPELFPAGKSSAERPVASEPVEPVKKKDTVSPFVDGGSGLTNFDPRTGQVVQETPAFAQKQPEVKLPEQKLPARNEFQFQPGKGLPEQKTAPLPKFVEEQLSAVKPELIGKTEENVVPQLKYQFGPLGFKFEETGVGDFMKATSPSGESIEISLDIIDPADREVEANKLNAFLRKGTTAVNNLSTLQKQYTDANKKIVSQKELDESLASINSEETKIMARNAEFVKTQNKLEAERAQLESVPVQQRNTPEYIARVDDFISKSDQFSGEFQSFIKDAQDLSKRGQQLNRSIGKYTEMKAQQGTWYGAALNAVANKSIYEMAKGFTGVAIDFLGEVIPTQAVMSQDDYERNFIEQAKKEGVDVSEGEDFISLANRLDETTLANIENRVRDVAKKTVRKDIIGSLDKTSKMAMESSGVSPEYYRSIEETFVGGALLGALSSIPAMAGGPVARTVLMGSQVLSGLDAEMANDPAFADISENEKYLVKGPIAVAVALLENAGLSNLLNQKGFLNGLVLKALGKIGKGASYKTFGEVIKNEIDSAVGRGALTLGAGFLAEAETGALQEVADIGFKAIYNKAKEKEMFDTPDSVVQFVEQVGKAGLQEGIGAGVLAVPGSISAAYRGKGFLGMDDAQFAMFEKMANDSNIEKGFIARLKSRINAGEITSAEGKDILNNYRNSISLFNSLPDNLDMRGKKEAMNLLKERRDLERQIAGKDQALTTPQRNRINEINQQLTGLSEAAAVETKPADNQKRKERIVELNNLLASDAASLQDTGTGNLIPEARQEIQQELETLKAEEDAIQKQAAGQVPVQPGTRVGQEVAQGEPQAEPQGVTEEDIEAKKADIEKRRKQELKERVVFDRVPTVEDGEFRIVGDPNKRIFRINQNTGRPQVLDESNGLWSNDAMPPNMFMETTKRSGFEKLKENINAKYDAEAAAIQPQEGQEKINDIESRRQKELKPYDDRDAISLESVTPNNPNHPIFQVGMKFSPGMNAKVEKLNTDNWDPNKGDGYSVISVIKSPAEVDSEGKMTKAAKVEVSIYNSKEEADAAIKAQYEKVQSKVGQKQKEINAKYDAELEELEQPTPAAAVSDIEKDENGEFIPKKYTLSRAGDNPAPNISINAIDPKSFGEEQLPEGIKQVKLLEIRGRNSEGKLVGKVFIQNEDGGQYDAEVFFNDAELAALEPQAEPVSPAQEVIPQVEFNEEEVNALSDLLDKSESEGKNLPEVFQLETTTDNEAKKQVLVESATKLMETVSDDLSSTSKQTNAPTMEPTPIVITENTELTNKVPRFPLVDLIKKKINLVMADQLKVGDGFMGGPLFPLIDGIFGKAAWASINLDAARKIVRGAINGDYSVVFNMNPTAVDSNTAFMDTFIKKLNEAGIKENVLVELKSYVKDKKFGKKTDQIRKIAETSNTIDEFSEKLSELDVDTISDFVKKIIPSKSVVAETKIGKILQAQNITQEDIRGEISEQLAKDLPMGAMTMVLKITDANGNPVTEKNIDDAIITPEQQKAEGIPSHRNYPFYVRGTAVGILDSTVPFWNMSKAAMSTINAKVAKVIRNNKGKTYSASQARAAAMRSASMKASKAFTTQAPTKSTYQQFIERLSKAIPSVEIVTSQKEFDNLLTNLNAKSLATKNQKIYGAVLDGKLYLNPSLENFNTPIHEFAHVWTNTIKELSPEIYQKGIELIKRSDYVSQIEASKDYKRITDKMKKDGATDQEISDYILEEALATAIGDKGESFATAAQQRNFKNWLNDLFAFIKKLTGISKLTPEQIQNISLDDFLNSVVVDLLSEKPIFKNAEVKNLNNQLQLMAKPDLKAEEIVKIGLANGFSVPAIKELLSRRGFTEQSIDKALGKKVPVKEGVPELFKDNPELASIGTTEDYSAYLDTIFPDSEVNNIAYHGSNYKFDTFKKAINPKNVYKEGAYKAGFFFSKDKETAKSYIDNKIIAKISNALNLSAPKNPTVYPVVLDIKNPVIEDRGGKRGIGFDEVNEAYDNKNDAYIAENVKDPNIPTDVYVVFNPEQIHILGSKKDIEDFKKFVSSKPTLSAAKKVEVTEEFAPGYDRVLNNMFGKDGVVAKSRRRGVSEEGTIENSINYLKGTKVYENATDVQREAMVRNVNKEFKKREKAAPSAEKVVGKPKKKEVTVDEMAALKDQIKLEARAAREAKGDLNTKRKALAAKIIAARKKGTITAAQARALVNKISKVNLDNPIMVDRLLAYIEKVFDNANYAADMDELRKLQRQARSRNHTSMTDAVNQFTSINPEDIPLDKVQDYKKALDFLNNRTPSYTSMNEIYDKTLSYQVDKKFDAIKTKEALNEKYKSIEVNKVRNVEEYVNLIKDINSFKRIAKKLLDNEAIDQDEYNNFIEQVGKDQAAVEETYEKEINKIKSDLISEIKTQRPKTNPQFSNEENDLIRRYLELSDADLKSLSPEDLFVLNDLLYNISNGEIDPYRFSDVVSRAYTSSGIDPLAKQIDDSKFDMTSTEGRKELSENESSFWEGLLGMGRAKAGALQKFIVSPFNRAIASYENSMRKSFDEFLKLKKKYDIDNEQMNKIGMLTTYLQEYMAQFDPKNKGVDNIGKRDWFKEILSDKSMRSKYSTGKPSLKKMIGLGSSDIDVIEKIWKSLPKDKDGNVDPKAVYDSYMANDGKFFNKKEKAFFDDVMKYKASEITPKQKIANEINGASFKEIPFHMMRVRLDGGKTQIAPTSSYENGVVRVKAGTGKERVSEAVGPIMTNFETLFIKGLEQTSRDYFLSKALKDINNTLSGVRKKINKDKLELLDTISYTLSDALAYEFERAESNLIFDTLLAARAAQTLLDPVRTGVELGATAVSFPTRAEKMFSGYKALFGEQKKMSKLLEFTDSPLRLRENINKAIDINEGSIEPQSRLTKMTTYLSGLPERTMMVTSWMPTFASEFQNITGEKFDINKFNDSSAYREKYGKAIREASAVADTQTEKIIGPTTKAGQRREIRIAPKFLASIIGREGTVSKSSTAGKILGFFSNYPYRETTEFINGFKEAAELIRKGEVMGSLSKLQKPLGVSLNLAAYGFLGTLAYAGQLILLGDEDDEERGNEILESLLTPQGALEEFASNAASLVASKYSAGGKALLQLAATIAIESTDDEDQKAKIKKILKNSVFVDPLPVEDVDSFIGKDKALVAIARFIPQFVMLADRYNDLIGTKNEIKAIYDKVEKNGIQSLTKDEELQVLALNTSFTIAQAVLNVFYGTSIPAYNRIKTLMKGLKEEAGVAEVYKGESPAKKKSSGGSSRGGGMNKTDMKKFNPELYDKMYGPGSAAYEIEQEVKAFEKEQREFKNKMKGQVYGGD